MKEFIFVMAQLDFLVGDIEGNAIKIIAAANTAKQEHHANLIIFPELALTGYPPEDLLLREGLYLRCEDALEKITKEVSGIDLLLGHPVRLGQERYNSASLICDGQIVATYHKHCLPNYSVFDEVRYFSRGTEPLVINYHGLPIGILICEDIWHKPPFEETIAAGAKLVACLNASPFDSRKHEARQQMLRHRAMDGKVPVLYVNCVGGQDELVFDGGSLILSEDGNVYQQGPFYQERLIPVDITYDTDTSKASVRSQKPLPLLSQEQRIYEALVLGVRDYVTKNHFPSVVLGLSGGIDSALTLAIAVDALGAAKVEAVMMPSRFTADLSYEIATEQAELMGVTTSLIPIEPIYCQFLETLAKEFANLPKGIAEENIQARCRGVILMAISNKKGCLVLSTGNKSELSVGYSTLYGDMVGGFCVLKDIPKTMVYRLAAYRNSLEQVIPQKVIDRPPTAELAYNQKDEDQLPPYALLDRILELYIEKDKGVQEIVDLGYEEAIVRKVVLMVDNNEYKRRQAPPGVRITTRAFGRDRRYPITSGYSHYLRK